MKNKLLSISMCLLLLTGFVLNASAFTEASDYTVEYFSDGSYAVVEIREVDSIATRGSVTTKVAAKDYKVYNGNGSIMYIFTVTGTFEINRGVSSKCTKAVPSVTIYDNNWREISKSAWPKGNQAIGTATLKRYMLGIPVRTDTPNVTLTCDKNGNLS